MRHLFLALAFLLPLPAFAGISIELPWAPPSLSQPNGVGFMRITSDEDDALVAARSDCCHAVELHTHRFENDVIRMRKVDEIRLPAGKAVLLRPGGYHIMLIGLHAPLKDGDTVKLTLEFAKADPITLELEVDRARLLERLKSPKH